MLKQKIKKIETVLQKLQSPETELDDAFRLYKEGTVLIGELNEKIERITHAD